MITIQLHHKEGFEQVVQKLDESSHDDFDSDKEKFEISVFSLDDEEALDPDVAEEIDFHGGIVI